MKFLMLISFSIMMIFCCPSFGAHQEVKDLTPTQKLFLLEKVRDVAEFQNLERAGFEKVTQFIAETLGEKYGPTFCPMDPSSWDETLFSLIRTRHYYKGMPTLVSENFFKYDAEKLQNGLFLQRMQVLFFLDRLVANSLCKTTFEDMWKDGAAFGNYPPHIIAILEQDFQLYGGNLYKENYGKNNTVNTLFKIHNTFFEKAFDIYSLFAPPITLESFYTEISQVVNWRGWIIHNDVNAIFKGLGELRSFRDSPLKKLHFFSTTSRGFWLPQEIEEDSAEFTIAIEYNFPYPLLSLEQNRFIITKSVKKDFRAFVYTNYSANVEKYLVTRDQNFASKKAGINFMNSPTERMEFLRDISRFRDPLPQFTYANANFNGMAGEQDFVAARAYHKLSADQGFMPAQFSYALMCRNGEGGDQDLPEARMYFKLAADQEEMESEVCYANMCYRGEGGDRNLKEAITYYERAVSKGNAAFKKVLEAARLELKSNQSEISETV